MANLITGIISITISAVILSSVFITQVKNANKTFKPGYGNTSQLGRWSSSETAMWGLLTLIAIVGLLYGVLNTFGLV